MKKNFLKSVTTGIVGLTLISSCSDFGKGKKDTNKCPSNGCPSKKESNKNLSNGSPSKQDTNGTKNK